MGIAFCCRRAARVAACVLLLATALMAKDAVQVAVTPLSGPIPVIALNGSGLTPGTYAIGTIQLFYTVVAPQFTAGELATFRLDLAQVQTDANRPYPAYPVTLSLTQNGSANLVLGRAPASFSGVDVGWSGNSVVTITIPQAVADDPAFAVDGAELVGNLNLSSSDPHLMTTTTVQVHVILAPPDQCLQVFHFMTDADVTYRVNSVAVTIKKNGGIQMTPPELSDDLLVVNTCPADQTFDLGFILDPYFETQPHDNPGNAVFTAVTAGALDPSNFWTMVASETGRSQQLCLVNTTVPGGSTLLARVHTHLNGTAPSTSPFSFMAELRTAGAACLGPLLPASLVNENPSVLSLPFTLTVK